MDSIQTVYTSQLTHKPVHSQSPLKAGDTVKDGRYEIDTDTVNAGGFGRIYRAYDTRQNRDGSRHAVAIKEFCISQYQPGMDRAYKLMRKKFKEEVKLLAALNKQHDFHVPTIHGDLIRENDRLMYVMTFINGPTLTEVVKKDGKMAEKVAVDYITQIGKVLYKAHNWGVFHCDISPNNIMLEGEGKNAILVDFGNAKSYNSMLSEQSDSEASSTSNDETCVVRTLGFSPSDTDLIGTAKGDVYSLAATLYYLLTGKTPLSVETDYGLEETLSTLKKNRVTKKTTQAIVNALYVISESSTQDIKTFLSQLPKDIVFNTLLNYNDYDYDNNKILSL